ncbi:hypothetical protein AB0L43_29235, partial [Micromonospora globbae]
AIAENVAGDAEVTTGSGKLSLRAMGGQAVLTSGAAPAVAAPVSVGRRDPAHLTAARAASLIVRRAA